MLIQEVAQDPRPDRLVGLVDLLAGRAEDTGARKQISKQAFMSLAQQLGVNITDQNIDSMLDRVPLKNLLEPIDPENPGTIVFKGPDQEGIDMPVDKAQDIVSKAAKSAMNRR